MSDQQHGEEFVYTEERVEPHGLCCAECKAAREPMSAERLMCYGLAVIALATLALALALACAVS